jgi:hypothetical protein
LSKPPLSAGCREITAGLEQPASGAFRLTLTPAGSRVVHHDPKPMGRYPEGHRELAEEFAIDFHGNVLE